MPTELKGYGPTAGEYMGGSGSNLNQQNNKAGVGAGGTGGANGSGNTTVTHNGNGVSVSAISQASANRKQIYAGKIPTGYTLKDGKIGYYVDRIIHESIGHGETRDRVVGKKFIEVPGFTALWNEGIADRASLNNAISFTTSAIQSLTKRLGVNAGKLADQMMNNVSGKTLRSYDAALGAFNKYNDSVLKHYGAADINAIKQSLAAIEQKKLATNLDKFSKSMGFVGYINDTLALKDEMSKSIKTGDWHGTLVKANAIVASWDAGAIAGAVLAMAVTAPESAVTIGVVSLFGAVAGSLITDDTIEKAGQLIDSTFHFK